MAEPAPSAEERSRYETIKKELLSALPRKRTIDKQLAQIEAHIHNLEATYLNETAQHSGGNIIHGFEGYLKNQTTGRRKYEINDQDRVFSNSSLTVAKSLELVGDNEEGNPNDEYVKQPTPGLTTVIVPPAPRTQELSASQNKRLRDKEYQRKKRASASMRSTGESEEEIVSTTSSSRRPTKRARMTEDD
ncbi:NuA4-domain-containing protein [Macrolepiota fuliginosa MF-IS2]|uniref:Chromatin modification-related protein EAF6 n=1 Tax=Macrolepiota fuliginosa MF-IS2 TaxID=1400762 RepID=A0A9P5XQ42_9AGAR|nr:NuA4-domain-containing protein [Macrolepiota fuliginosa MF-IS2]